MKRESSKVLIAEVAGMKKFLRKKMKKCAASLATLAVAWLQALIIKL
jgi:hypothetical protein